MDLSAVYHRFRRTWFAAAAAFAFGIGAVVAVTAVMPAVSAQQGVDLDAEGLAANQGWWGALLTGEVTAVDAVLAPEFQIQRANGSGYDKAGYLASSLPRLEAMPEFSAMAVTAHGDYLVTRYFVTTDETIDGGNVERHAPRLTVFRKVGDAWLVVAHGNFAAIDR
jgi:hypothetical protein